MSILNHPDYESCIKPWCTAVAAGKEPPKVEFGDAQHVWTLVEVPVWYNERRYRLVPRRIKIGSREVNAPVSDGLYVHAVWVSGYALAASKDVEFATKADAEAARDAIYALLKGEE